MILTEYLASHHSPKGRSLDCYRWETHSLWIDPLFLPLPQILMTPCEMMTLTLNSRLSQSMIKSAIIHNRLCKNFGKRSYVSKPCVIRNQVFGYHTFIKGLIYLIHLYYSLSSPTLP